MSEQPIEVVYRDIIPLAELVPPDEFWKVGDRVISRYGDGPGVIHQTQDFEREQNVGVIFDAQPDTLAWLCDDEVFKEGN